MGYIISLTLLSIFLKFLLTNFYWSTDFEVHRNWLAVTYNKPLSEWYTENTSQWTLDYPPLFAWFEWILSQLAVIVDPSFVKISSQPYVSFAGLIFHRLSVIITELLLTYSYLKCFGDFFQTASFLINEKTRAISLFVLFNYGLILVDNIHFQYNGFLMGILFCSYYALLRNEILLSGLLFAILLNMKHLFLYLSPIFFMHIFSNFCFTSNKKLIFHYLSFLKIGIIVLVVFTVSLGPFVYVGKVSNIFDRLFPFNRGLTHAYWAPNVWAIYNIIDLVWRSFSQIQSRSFYQSGLVQNSEHVVLPSIKPSTTAFLVLLTIFPFLVKILRNSNLYHGLITPHSEKVETKVKNKLFLVGLIGAAWASFCFGWHVHEKAIIVVLLPLNLLAALDRNYCFLAFYTTTIGHYSLMPLIHTPLEQPTVYTLFIASCMLHFYSLNRVHSRKRIIFPIKFGLFEILGIAHMLGLLPLFLMTRVICPIFWKKLEFLPLALTSFYCSIGLVFGFIFFSILSICGLEVIDSINKKLLNAFKISFHATDEPEKKNQ